MTLKISIQPTVQGDLDELAVKMRSIDIDECRITLGMAPRESLELSYNASYEVLTGRVDDKLIAIYGISRLHALSTEATPWLLATDLIEEYAFVVAKENKRMVSEWHKRHSRLSNYVHVDNKIAIRWLRWLGFDIKEPVPFGLSGEMFRPFELIRR